MSSRLAVAWAAGWPPARVPARRPTTRRLQASCGESSTDSWERLCLAKRKLELAVREEDYSTAAAAKAEVDLLLERLPSSRVVLSGLLSKLEVCGSSDRQTTILQLGKLGDMAAVPSLAKCLHDADPDTAAAAEEAMWACFMRCPTPELEMQMQRGVALMQADQLEQAVAVFDDIIAKAPSFAEGYNKRATCLYLMQRYHAAILDCRLVLEMNPFHFGAASGMGMCCGHVNDTRGALAAFRQAVAINSRQKPYLMSHIAALQRQQQREEEQRGRQSNE